MYPFLAPGHFRSPCRPLPLYFKHPHCTSFWPGATALCILRWLPPACTLPMHSSTHSDVNMRPAAGPANSFSYLSIPTTLPPHPTAAPTRSQHLSVAMHVLPTPSPIPIPSRMGVVCAPALPPLLAVIRSANPRVRDRYAIHLPSVHFAQFPSPPACLCSAFRLHAPRHCHGRTLHSPVMTRCIEGSMVFASQFSCKRCESARVIHGWGVILAWILVGRDSWMDVIPSKYFRCQGFMDGD